MDEKGKQKAAFLDGAGNLSKPLAQDCHGYQNSRQKDRLVKVI